jgi:hypothetical protein
LLTKLQALSTSIPLQVSKSLNNNRNIIQPNNTVSNNVPPFMLPMMMPNMLSTMSLQQQQIFSQQMMMMPFMFQRFQNISNDDDVHNCNNENL